MFSARTASGTLLLLLCVARVDADDTTSALVRMNPITPTVATDVRSIVITGETSVEKEVELLKPTNLELSCLLTEVSDEPENVSGHWRKGEEEITDGQVTVQRKNDQYYLQKIISIAADSLGKYSCVFQNKDWKANGTYIVKVPAMKEKRDKPIVSFVGDSAVMTCKIRHAPVEWRWFRVNGSGQEEINMTVNPLHYKIQVKDAGNESSLTVMNLTEEDSGVYLCSALYDITPSHGRVELRVITFLEPLKPFLVIVVEVVLLVTLILLYELLSKRRQDRTTAENGMHTEQKEKLRQEDPNGVEESSTRKRKV